LRIGADLVPAFRIWLDMEVQARLGLKWKFGGRFPLSRWPSI
jgi:hypothetical protein